MRVPVGRYAGRISAIAFVAIGASNVFLPFTRAQDSPVQPARDSTTQDTPVTQAAAKEFLNSGAYEQAAAAFEKLTRDPSQAREAALGLARCRLETGKYDEAIQDLTKLNAADSAEWHFLLARLYDRIGRYEDLLTHTHAANELNKNHAPARLLRAQTLELLGRRDEALEAYRWFDQQLVGQRELPRDSAWITHTALGFLRFSVLTQTNVVARTKHVLSEMLQTAYTKLDRAYWPARIAAADLLREKFNNDADDGSVSDYVAALRINEHLPEAHVGLGLVTLENWNFEETEKQAGLALAVNPNFSPARHLLARKFIVERRYEQASEECDKALAINPNDMAAMSLKAGAAACRFDEPTVRRMQAKVEALNRRPAFFHRTVGDALSGIRQYAASEAAYLKAIEFDPNDANARTELGMMYMQWGEEAKARAALDAAWNLDPYNERTKFTLDLLQSLEKFTRYETANFMVKYDAEKDPGLGEFLGGYLEEIYEPVTRDFATSLKDKTIIEVFPSHAGFSVRITGRPWIPTVGACSGRVIALASPRSGDDRLGPYNIARVLKHEFTHTVTLAVTENRIPHWFTEGLAVYQEDSPRSFEWAELLADAVRKDELFTLQTIDWGFMRPKKPTDRTMAYAQSEWMCEFIVERFGYDAIGKMLDRYRGHRTQPEVLKELFGMEPEAFDKEFRPWAREQVLRWGFVVTPPEDLSKLRDLASSEQAGAGVFGRVARAEYDERNGEEALAAAQRAIELDEKNADGLEVLCKLLAQRVREIPSEAGRRAGEDVLLPKLQQLSESQPKGWTAPKFLGEIYLRRKEWDAAFEPLKRLQTLCPMDPISWRGLSGIHLDRGEDDLALPQLLELARSEEHDPTVAAHIAEIHRKKGRLKEAQYWYRQSIFIDPFNPTTHKSLGDTAMQAGDTASALDSYRMLTKLEPKQPKHFENAAFAAHKLGKTDEARSFAQRAVELDPKSPAKSLLP